MSSLDSEFEITLFIYPSPFGVDWRSPYHLTKSALINAASFRRRMIGHVAIEIKGSEPTRFVGMSTQHFRDNKKLLLLKGVGLGIMLHQYPGFLEQESDLAAERDERLRSGRFSFVKFKLSKASYLKVHRYLTEYEGQKKYLWYGLPNRPRFGEGAGCSAFAVSFLEVANILEDEFIKNWGGKVKLPLELIGTKTQKVSIFKLLFPTNRNSKWADESRPGVNVCFWDPDQMHRWVTTKIKNKQSLAENYKTAQIENTHGLVIDMRDRHPSEESIWL